MYSTGTLDGKRKVSSGSNKDNNESTTIKINSIDNQRRVYGIFITINPHNEFATKQTANMYICDHRCSHFSYSNQNIRTSKKFNQITSWSDCQMRALIIHRVVYIVA
jgi:hypothetical protein